MSTRFVRAQEPGPEAHQRDRREGRRKPENTGRGFIIETTNQNASEPLRHRHELDILRRRARLQKDVALAARAIGLLFNECPHRRQHVSAYGNNARRIRNPLRMTNGRLAKGRPQIGMIDVPQVKPARFSGIQSAVKAVDPACHDKQAKRVERVG
nr:hypothetical protein [Martelella mediterranea]